MSLFICDNCGCVENTAFGNWWIRDSNHKLDVNPETNKPFPNGMALCSECAPDKYADGQYRYMDRNNKPRLKGWHNQFPRRLWDGSSSDLENCPKSYSDYIQKFKVTWEIENDTVRSTKSLLD